MKILYIVQQSIYDNDGNWISADSNVNMFVGIVRELLKITDWEFHVVMAQPFKDISGPEELLSHERLHYYVNDYPVDSVMSRYVFGYELYSKLINDIKPDIVWNNISEITRNLYALTKYIKSNAKIISCNYWIDAPKIDEGKVADSRLSYSWRQIDGALAANLVPFTCESTRDIFISNMRETVNIDFARDVIAKSTIWDFGFSMRELDAFKTTEKFNKPTIVFPNRLSGINYTHHMEFIEAINLLSRVRDDFQVVFTNPTHKVSWDWLKTNVRNLHVISEDILSREQYGNLLWKADIVVNLFDIERYGGCSNVEAMHCGCLPIMPRYGEYNTRAASHYPCFIELPITVERIVSALSQAINIVKFNESSDWLNPDWISKSAYEEVAPIVVRDINFIVNAGGSNEFSKQSENV